MGEVTAAKVWDGSQWMTVTDLVGPPGPQGPAGLGTQPSGAAGGALTGNYPNPGISKVAAGGMIAVQRIWGQSNTYGTILTGESFKVDAAKTIPLAISYTPTVPVWWEVECSIGILQKLDAAYHYAYLILSMSPADADGQNARQMIEMQHAHGDRGRKGCRSLIANTSISVIKIASLMT